MTPQKHAPELVEAALGFINNIQCPADQLFAFFEYRRSHESLALEDCVEKILRSHIAALTEENAQLKTILRLSDSDSLQAVQTEARHIEEIKILRAKLAAFDGAEEVVLKENSRLCLFTYRVVAGPQLSHVSYVPAGTHVFIVRPKPSKQEETP